ncbi:MAG: Crp/Fnr family transcriptional regulator [Candidatus Saccharimonadales bacterium]
MCDNKAMLTNANQMQVLVNFFHTGTKLTYSKGEFVIRPGESPPGIFYIEQGLVKAYDITKYGEENLLIIRKAGEILALTWAITGQDRSIIYSALAPTTVWMVTLEDFLAFVHSQPSAALPLTDMLTEMYRLHSERILTLEYRTVRERLISFLLTASHRFGKKVPSGILLDVPLKHQDIASSISATRETTSRALSELDRKGLLRSENSYITLLDTKSLKNFL